MSNDLILGKRTPERFYKKCEPVTESGCWLWTASTAAGGYGRISCCGRLHPAHRASRVIHVGPIPAEMHVLHKCDTPSCVNPAHLFLGTHAENMADRSAKGRCADTRGDSHPRAKLSATDIPLIRADERTHREIADSYGVQEPAIFKIKHKLSWAHIPDEAAA